MSLARHLLAWYDRHRRRLPWRAEPGERANPYHVWLSEIMLQQTTVATVGPYFRDFIQRWSTVGELAAADLDEILHAWQGLGYYARARNLHRAAKVVAERHAGKFPESKEGLLDLPGVGAYTAAAIAAIAFGKSTTPVDGNIERVTARLFAVRQALPAAKPELRRLAAMLTPKRRAGDFAQALMDLGATICLAGRPNCLLCPIAADCQAYAMGIADDLPARSPKPARPLRHGAVFWAVRRDGSVLLRRRPEKGLLGGMMEFPSSEWRAKAWRGAEALSAVPFPGEWTELPGLVRHSFTHFELELKVFAGRVRRSGKDGVWCPIDRLSELALPTLMKKVARHALAAVGSRRP